MNASTATNLKVVPGKATSRASTTHKNKAQAGKLSKSAIQAIKASKGEPAALLIKVRKDLRDEAALLRSTAKAVLLMGFCFEAVLFCLYPEVVSLYGEVIGPALLVVLGIAVGIMSLYMAAVVHSVAGSLAIDAGKLSDVLASKEV